MSEEYGPNFVTLTDEEGEEENEDEYGLIILKSETVDGEEMLANVVDEDEINEVYDLFMEQMMEDEEE